MSSTATYRRASSPRLRRVGAALVLAAAAAGTSIATARPAAADPLDSYISSNSGGANMRTCANTGCAPVAYLSNGTAIYMLCYTDAQVVSPPSANYTSSRWFKVGLHYDNRDGYVHSSLVTHQSSVPRC